MVTLTLGRRDAAVLAQVLESYLSELRVEIIHTDNRTFRESLKDRRDTLRRIVDALEAKAA